MFQPHADTLSIAIRELQRLIEDHDRRIERADSADVVLIESLQHEKWCMVDRLHELLNDPARDRQDQPDGSVR